MRRSSGGGVTKITKSTAIPYDEIRLQFLKKRKEVDFALKLAVREFHEDGQIEPLLHTLRLLAQARGGIAKLARESDICWTAVDEALWTGGNPRLRTFLAVLETIGLRITLKAARRPMLVRRRKRSLKGEAMQQSLRRKHL
jgi:DNA-binding phage protein